MAAPSFHITPSNYSELVKYGFRRSGTFVYRPGCEACQQCVAVRIPVAEFVPNRSQRRSWKQHQSLEVSMHPLGERAGHFELYQRYQQQRHAEGGMAHDDYQQFQAFLLQSQVDSMLLEYHEAGVLRMVSVVDVLDDGLSAVYTFYDPAILRSSYGIFNVLWQIELCRQLQLPFLYPGYWIEQSPKMSYKANFKPLQALQNESWQPLIMESQT